MGNVDDSESILPCTGRHDMTKGPAKKAAEEPFKETCRIPLGKNSR